MEQDNDKIKAVYQKLKKEYQNKGLVTGTKSSAFDFLVLGWEADLYIKILLPLDVDQVENMIHYMQGFALKRKFFKMKYIIYYLNENHEITTQREIQLT